MISQTEHVEFAGGPLIRAAQQIRTLSRAADLNSVSWKPAKTAILLVADALRNETGQIRLPVRLDQILQLRKIVHQEFFPSQSAPEATLAPVVGGFVLRLRPGLNSVRARFSQAHEIGHTLFYDIDKDPPEKLLRLRPGTILSRKEEDICNAFARVLLLPADLVNDFLTENRMRSKWDVLNDLKVQFEVSREATCRRLLQDFGEFARCVAVFADEFSSNGKCKPRRWIGRALTSFRGVESQLLDSLNEAFANLAGNCLEEQFKRIAVSFNKVATIDWEIRLLSKKDFSAALLVDFEVSRAQSTSKKRV